MGINYSGDVSGFGSLNMSDIQKTQDERQAEAEKFGFGDWNAYQSAKAEGRPMRPQYQSSLGDNGLIQDKYKLGNAKDVNWGDEMKWNGVNWGPDVQWGSDISYKPTSSDQSGLNAMKQRALGSGDTPWASLAKNQSREEQRFGLDNIAQQGASDRAQAEASLASRGGLSGGAAERLALGSSRDIAMRRQQAMQEGIKQRLGISTQDQAGRDQMLQNLPGAQLGQAQFDSGQQQALSNMLMQNRLNSKNIEMQNRQGSTNLALENQKGSSDLAYRQREAEKRLEEQNSMNAQNTEKYNLSNALQEMQMRNQANLSAYDDQMKAWAAQKQSDATQKAGDSSGCL